jgi:hypothetical protein
MGIEMKMICARPAQAMKMRKWVETAVCDTNKLLYSHLESAHLVLCFSIHNNLPIFCIMVWSRIFLLPLRIEGRWWSIGWSIFAIFLCVW